MSNSRGKRERRRAPVNVRTFAVILAASSTLAHAGSTVNWTSSTGGAWSDAANWNGGAGPAPVAADTAEFDLANAYAVTFSATNPTVSVYQTAGAVSWQSDGVARSLSFSPVTVSGGSLALGLATPQAATLNVTSSQLSVDSGASVSLSGGNDWTVGSGGPVSLGLFGSTTAAPASLTLSGAGTTFTHTGTGPIDVGKSGFFVTPIPAALTIANGATFTSGAGSTLTVGPLGSVDYTGGTLDLNGNVTVSGGTFKGAAPTAHALLIGTGRTLTVNSGGKVDLTGDVELMTAAASTYNTVTASQSRFTTTGTIKLNYGSGVTAINNGGLISAPALQIGTIAAGSRSSYARSSNGASLSIAGDVTVGSMGNLLLDTGGTLTIGGKLTLDGYNITANQRALLTSGGANQVTVAGEVRIGATAGPVGANISGTGASFTQTGSAPVTIGNGTGTSASSTYLTSDNGTSITLGTGLLTVNKGQLAGANITVNGDVLVKNGGVAQIGKWAAGRTATVNTGGQLQLGTQALSGNTIVATGAGTSISSGGTITLNGNSKLMMTGGGGNNSLWQSIDVGTDGSAGTLEVGTDAASGGTTSATLNALPYTRWGANGGQATITFGDGGPAVASPRASVSLGETRLAASGGAGTRGTLLVRNNATVTYGSRLYVQTWTDAGSGAAGIVTVTGPNAKLTLGSATFGGAIGTGAATFNVSDGGTFTRSAGGTLQLNPTATMNVTAGGNVALDALAIGGGKLNLDSGNLSTGASLTIINGGQLDVGANELVVKAAALGTASGGAYDGVTGLIQSGRAGGAWTGTGIVTSQSDAQMSASRTSVGVARAGDINRTGAVVGGVTLAAADVLVAYTFAGDADLNGKLDGDDYFRIDSHVGTATPGWSSGDFDYNGIVDGDDYFLLDRNLGRQTLVSTFATAGGSAGLSAVPEPASIAGFGMSLLFCAAKRRRRGSS
jgi:hypothetical protein